MNKFLFLLLLAPLIFSIDISKTSKMIKKGKIKVGKEYGMEIEKRYHKIHNEILKLDCQSCHIEKFSKNYLYQSKHKTFSDMGPVDRGICLGCHKKNGPAETKLYGTAED